MNIYISTDSPCEPYVRSVIDHLKKNYNIIERNPLGISRPEWCNLRNFTFNGVKERASEDKILIDNSDIVIMVFPYIGYAEYIKSFYALGAGKKVIAICDFNFQYKVKDVDKYKFFNCMHWVTKIIWNIKDIDSYLESIS